MADLTITAASVVKGAGAVTKDHTASATITAGQVVARDSSTGLVAPADNNSATAYLRTAYGVALNGGAVNQPIEVCTRGPVTIGATMTAGVAYYLSDTPGGICPVADMTSGEYPTILGIATSTTVLNLNLQSAGVAL